MWITLFVALSQLVLCLGVIMSIDPSSWWKKYDCLLKCRFWNQQNGHETWSQKTVKFFVLSQEVGASCVSAAPCPPSWCLSFSVTHPPTTVNTYISSFQGWIGRLSSEATVQQGSTRRLLSTAFGRRAPGKRRVHVHTAFRPTLTIEDLGTRKPTSCTDFCVAH